MTLYNLGSWERCRIRRLLHPRHSELISTGPAIFIVPAITKRLSHGSSSFAGASPLTMIGKDHVPDDAAGEHDLDTPGMRKRAQAFLLMAWIGNATTPMSPFTSSFRF